MYGTPLVFLKKMLDVEVAQGRFIVCLFFKFGVRLR
jgi:hypothetical protein